jgi:hypothetical protein
MRDRRIDSVIIRGQFEGAVVMHPPTIFVILPNFCRDDAQRVRRQHLPIDLEIENGAVAARSIN